MKKQETMTDAEFKTFLLSPSARENNRYSLMSKLQKSIPRGPDKEREALEAAHELDMVAGDSSSRGHVVDHAAVLFGGCGFSCYLPGHRIAVALLGKAN